MSAQSINLLDNVFALLDCFSQEKPDLGVREAARLAGLSSSTTGRLMVAMRDAGILTQNPDTHSYRLGSRVLHWAGVFTSTLDLRATALPTLQELHRSTNETVTLYVLEGEERVCVERFESSYNLRLVNRIGRRMPLYAGSGGKAILAFLSTASQEKIMSRPMQPFTEHTIVDPGRLAAQLAQIRAQGYAPSDGEWVAEAAGVGAPIFDQTGQVIGSVVISGPSQRFTPDLIVRYAREVVRGAQQISTGMGYFSPRTS